MTAVVAVPSAQDFCTLVNDMWTSFLGEQTEPLVLVSAESPAVQRTRGEVIASVSTTGAWNGHLMLALTQHGAELVARAMFGDEGETVAEEDVIDAIGEMSNIIAGNIKSVLPEPSALSLPQVVVDAGTFSFPSAVLRVTATMDWAGESVVVSLWEASLPEGGL